METSIFDNIQSAEVVNPEELPRLIEERSARLRAAGKSSDAAQTHIGSDADGRSILLKQTSSAIDRSSLPSSDQLAALAKARGLEWADGSADRVFPWWASDERVDRHGDIVRQRWTFEAYAKNPLMLWSHDWNLPPIGAVLQEMVTGRTDGDYSGPALHLISLFTDAWDWAETIFRLVRGGFLRTGSIGMFPGDVVRITDPEERARLGLGEWGLVYGMSVPNELVEWTVASVPSNIGAHLSTLRSMKSIGTLQFSDIQPLRELARRDIRRGRRDGAAWRDQDLSLLAIWHSLYPERVLPEHVELDYPIFLQALKSESDRSAERPSSPETTTGDGAADVLSPQIAMLKEAMDAVRQDLAKLSCEVDGIRRISDDIRTNVEGRDLTPQPAKNNPNLKVVLQDLLSATERTVQLLNPKS